MKRHIWFVVYSDAFSNDSSYNFDSIWKTGSSIFKQWYKDEETACRIQWPSAGDGTIFIESFDTGSDDRSASIYSEFIFGWISCHGWISGHGWISWHEWIRWHGWIN